MEKLQTESQNSSELIYCEICCSPGLRAENLPCEHQYCFNCLQVYMKTRIDVGTCEIYCPWPECSYKFPAWRVIEILDQESKEQFLNLTLRKALALSRETRYCPGTNCDFALFIDPAVISVCGPVIKCHNLSCGAEFCYYCKELWHPTRLCAPTQANFPGMKKCPRCGIYIMKQKDDSCNQMLCTACDHEFCWLCLEKFSPSHFPFSCPAFGRRAYSKRRRLWNRAIFGATLPVTVPITVAVLSGVMAANLALLAAIGSISSPFILAKKLNKYLRMKNISNTKRKAAVAGGTGLAVLVFPALAPWGIYRTVQWVHGQILKLDAMDGTNEFNFEEPREVQTRSLSEAKVESLGKNNRSWSVPDLVEPWDIDKATPSLLDGDGNKPTRYSFVEPTDNLSSVEKDAIVALKATEIKDEPSCDDEFVVVWSKDGMKIE